MKSVPLLHNGVASLFVGMAALDGASMPQRRFLVDTGATKTTIPKAVLVNALGYTEEYIRRNKIILAETEKPYMANGKRADVYKLKAPRINIGGHELQPDFILTSDVITSLNLLLGLDILRYFKFTFDFDSIDDDAPYGRMFYEFRANCFEPFTKLGDPFAFSLSSSEK